MSKKIFMSILTTSSAVMLIACANPTAVTKGDAVDFKAQFPDHIQTLNFEGQNIRYAWSGDSQKRALLFVHGSPGSWEGWSHFLLDPELQRRFQIIAVDRPGYGGSSEGVTETSVYKQAADIAAVLQINKSGLPAFLVGHSYGGPVVAQMAMSYPKQVAGVVFVASSVDPTLEKTKWYQYPATWWPIRVLLPSKLRVCNEEILALKGELTRMLPGWSSFQAKAVLIQGAEDTLVPPQNLNFLLAHIKKDLIVKSVRVEGLNHFIPWKRPDLIFDGIRELENSVSQ
jgi:pimeloyl-ACP methyl ester carboxylesterase